MSETKDTLEPLVCMRLGWVGVSSEEQVQAIIDRALSEPPPVEHSHSWEECGMCLECDAAAVLRMARDRAAWGSGAEAPDRLFAVAARRDLPNTGRLVIPRCGRQGAAARAAIRCGPDCVAGRLPCRSGPRWRARSPGRDVVCRRRNRRFRPVLGRRRRGHARGKQARPAAATAAASRAGKSPPARRADRADRIVVGDRADRAGGGGAGSGQSRASDRREDARRGAGLLFYRHPAGPARRFRGHRARRPGRAYATSADDARPHYKAERHTGRASAGCARGSLGVAQRPRLDLFRSDCQTVPNSPREHGGHAIIKGRR